MYTLSSVSRKAAATIDRKGLPTVFTYSGARAAGLSAERLYTYRDQGIVEQIGRGRGSATRAEGRTQDGTPRYVWEDGKVVANPDTACAAIVSH